MFKLINVYEYIIIYNIFDYQVNVTITGEINDFFNNPT